MKIEDIEFVELPSKSYYAFRYDRTATGVKKDGDEVNIISCNDEQAWKFNDDQPLEFLHLGKKNQEGLMCGGYFSYEERLFTGPDRKKIFKWVIVEGVKYFVYEEIPPAMLNSFYRYQYKLVPVEKVFKELGIETEEVN